MSKQIEFNFDELIAATHEATTEHLTKEQTAYAVDNAFQALRAAIDKAGRVEMHGFGTFTVKRTAERHGVDPNGKPFVKPAGKKIAFKAWKDWRNKLESGQ